MGKRMAPLGCLEALQVILDCVITDEPIGKQTTMLRKRGVAEERPFVFERRNPIADGLGGFGRHDGSDDRADLSQGAAGRLWEIVDVFMHN
jgi:hypothetical protein